MKEGKQCIVIRIVKWVLHDNPLIWNEVLHDPNQLEAIDQMRLRFYLLRLKVLFNSVFGVDPAIAGRYPSVASNVIKQMIDGGASSQDANDAAIDDRIIDSNHPGFTVKALGKAYPTYAREMGW